VNAHAQDFATEKPSHFTRDLAHLPDALRPLIARSLGRVEMGDERQG
jgi:hypothetical protein